MWIQVLNYGLFMMVGGSLCILQFFHQAAIVFLFSTIVPALLIDWDKIQATERNYFWVCTAIGIAGFMIGALLKLAINN
jgi:hypothetical protein